MRGSIHHAPERRSFAGSSSRARPVRLSELELVEATRYSTGSDAWDQVLGGGCVAPSSIILSGDPGVGKTTALTAIAAELAEGLGGDALFVSAEMTEDKVAQAASRAGAKRERLVCLATASFEEAEQYARAMRPRVLVFDSIQMLELPSLRHHAAAIEVTRRGALLGEDLGAVTWLICHVTKDAGAAGPNTLKHLVDVLVHLGKDNGARYVETTKNRHGATLRVFLDA